MLNHELTPMQIKELEHVFFVSCIVYPDNYLNSLWAGIPTVQALTADDLSPFTLWIDENSHSKDLIIIQGEFGASFFLIEYAFSKGLIPLHSVTKRVAHETKEDETIIRTYTFQHICFRRYLRYLNSQIKED